MRSSGKVKGHSSAVRLCCLRGDESQELLPQMLQCQLKTNMASTVVIGGSLNIQTRAVGGVSSALQCLQGCVTAV